MKNWQYITDLIIAIITILIPIMPYCKKQKQKMEMKNIM